MLPSKPAPAGKTALGTQWWEEEAHCANSSRERPERAVIVRHAHGTEMVSPGWRAPSSREHDENKNMERKLTEMEGLRVGITGVFRWILVPVPVIARTRRKEGTKDLEGRVTLSSNVALFACIRIPAHRQQSTPCSQVHWEPAQRLEHVSSLAEGLMSSEVHSLVMMLQRGPVTEAYLGNPQVLGDQAAVSQ